MAKKIIIDVPDYEETENCERCGDTGAADFGTERICMQCACNDVFEVMNDKTD